MARSIAARFGSVLAVAVAGVEDTGDRGAAIPQPAARPTIRKKEKY
jgi:hypothetical protein